MTTLSSLPEEILRLILSHLANTSLQSLFLSSSTCKAFHRLIIDIISNTPQNHTTGIYNFLELNFAAILNGVRSPSSYFRAYAPFHELPWVSHPIRWKTWLRRDASWRQIPLVSPSGQLVHWLQRVRHWRQWEEISGLEGGYVGFRIFSLHRPDELSEPYFYFSKGLDLGLYWDYLLESGPVALYGGWEMCWETRLENVAEWNKFCKEVHLSDHSRGPTNDEIAQSFTTDKNHALLRFYGEQFSLNGEPRTGKKEHLWLEKIGKDEKYEADWLRMCPWSQEEAKWGSRKFGLPPRSSWPRTAGSDKSCEYEHASRINTLRNEDLAMQKVSESSNNKIYARRPHV